jgi:hypothetical protein
MGSGLPQFGFPRRFAIDLVSLRKSDLHDKSSETGWGCLSVQRELNTSIIGIFSSKINRKMMENS